MDLESDEDSDETRILNMKQEHNNRFRMLCVCIAIACVAIVAFVVIGALVVGKMDDGKTLEQKEIPYIYDQQVDKKSDYYFSKKVNSGPYEFIHYG